MNWFMKLGLAKKLLSAFFTLAVIAAAMGLFGLSNIVSMGSSMQRMYDNNLLATVKAQIAFREYLIYIRTVIRFLTQEGEEREETVKRSIEYRERAQAAFNEYRQTEMSPAEVVLADKVQAGVDKLCQGRPGGPGTGP